MSLLSGLLGNATEVDVSQIERDLAHLLVDQEKIEKAFVVIRDSFIFTNKRLIIIDKQGVTGKKVHYHSLPYKSITQFSVELAGHFDLDSELRIWVKGTSEPLQKQFKKGSNIVEIQRALGEYVLNYSH